MDCSVISTPTWIILPVVECDLTNFMYSPCALRHEVLIELPKLCYLIR